MFKRLFSEHSLFYVDSIRRKLVAILTLILIVVITTFGTMSYVFISNTIKIERVKDVKDVADQIHKEFRTSLLNHIQNLEELSARLSTYCFIQKPRPRYLENCIRTRLEFFLSHQNAIGVLFYGINGETFVMGTKIPEEMLNATWIPNQIALFQKRSFTNIDQPFLLKIQNSETKTKIFALYPLELISNLFHSTYTLGKTGEAFLSDNKGYFITKPKHNPIQGLHDIIKAKPMQTCLSKANGDALAEDYSLQQIIHGFQYIPEIGGGCIMAHISQKEAFAELSNVANKLIIASILLFIISTIFSFLFAHSISAPLVYLANVAMAISKGNYRLKSNIKRTDEIGLLSDSFNKMTDKLIEVKTLEVARAEAEAANAQKSAFLASMSHEIRTPLNSIIGITSVLLESTLSHSHEKLLKVAHSAGENLLCLINDVLDISRIESGVFSIEETEFNLHDQISNCISIIQIRAKEKGIQLNLMMAHNLPLWVIGDPTRFRQVLLNLLSNAVKFSENGTVTVLASIKETHSRSMEILVSVRDQGIGIPRERQTIIFDKFKQADQSITRKYGGTGLGLFISKKLVEAMNGTIWLESTVGKGSIFFFTLKLKTPSNHSYVESKSQSVQQYVKHDTEIRIKQTKILCVDDSVENQLIFGLFLQKQPGYKHNLTFANNGKEAIEKIKHDTFDLIFMDIQMPILDGYTTTREIRKWEVITKKPSSLIIACTAHAFIEDIVASHQAGCNEHLTKPIKRDSLYGLIDKYIQSAT